MAGIFFASPCRNYKVLKPKLEKFLPKFKGLMKEIQANYNFVKVWKGLPKKDRSICLKRENVLTQQLAHPSSWIWNFVWKKDMCRKKIGIMWFYKLEASHPLKIFTLNQLLSINKVSKISGRGLHRRFFKDLWKKTCTTWTQIDDWRRDTWEYFPMSKPISFQIQ